MPPPSIQTNPPVPAAAPEGGADPGLEPPLRRSRRGHGRQTLDDVAREAGVTKITVSRYLREPQRVAPATAERIRTALAATGYVPNKQAGLLASGRSNIVAALVPNLSHSIFGETVQALSVGLQDAGLELLLAATGFSPEREEEQLRAVLGWAPAAIVVTGRRHTPGGLALLARAQAGGTPVVEVWDHHADAPAPFAQIGFSHSEVGRAMAEHLLAAGHRRLAYLDSGVAADFRAHERGAAFAAAAAAAGAEVQVVTAVAGDPFDAGRQALPRLRALGATAVACATDHLGCGLMLQALDDGLQVPRDLAVLGFGDFPVGRQLRPALSTVRPPSDAIGRSAAQVVVAALAAGQPARSRLLPWTLLPRGSTAQAA